MATVLKVNEKHHKFFRFKLENEKEYYVVPQTVTDGSDVITFNSNWVKQNLPGSTEPMVAYNYTDAPSLNVELKFYEDMWRELDKAIPSNSTYQKTVNKLVSLMYPSASGSIIKPPYVKFSYDNIAYRGYFSSLRVNQNGPIRNGYRINCTVSGQFIVIRTYAPKQIEILGTGYRTYFGT